MAARNVVFGLSLASAAFFVALAGCGGIDEPDLFASGSASSGDSGTKADAKADGAVTTDSGTKPDGGVTVIDSGTPPPTGGADVFCGDTSCSSSADEECCYSVDDQAGECVSTGAKCPNDTEIPVPCDDSADCDALGSTGDVCCATATNNGSGSPVVSEVRCRPASDCKAANGQTNLCDPNASDPCPNGGTCQPSSVSIPGYYICR